MNSLLSKIRDIGIGFGATLLFAAPAMAQTIASDKIEATTKIGDIGTTGQFVNFVVNLLTYLGWIGVILGVAIAIFGLIYKLVGSDSEEAMKNVQGYLTKAVLIVVAGLLLVSFGYIINVVTTFFGLNTTVVQVGGDLDTGVGVK